MANSPDAPRTNVGRAARPADGNGAGALGRVAEQVEEAGETVAEKAEREAEEYRGPEPRPLGPLLGIMGTYLTLFGVAAAVATRRGRWPKRLRPDDFVLGIVATHRVSMIIARETVTSPLRAPFTKFEGPAGEGQLKEQVRGTGWRKAMGELLTCPFCLAQWVATTWAVGFMFFPRATRMAATVFTTVTAADWLHRLDAKMKS